MNSDSLKRYADAFLPTFKAAAGDDDKMRDAIGVLVKHVEREARHRAARQIQNCMNVVGEPDQPLNV